MTRQRIYELAYLGVMQEMKMLRKKSYITTKNMEKEIDRLQSEIEEIAILYAVSTYEN